MIRRSVRLQKKKNQKLGTASASEPASPPKSATLVVGRGVSVRKSRIQGAGKGLFTDVALRKGALITFYDGEQIERKTAEARRRNAQASHIRSINYSTQIDGLKKPITGRGGASFANDGSAGKANNAVFATVAREPDVVFLKASRDMAAGEEVLVSYGNGYWKAAS